MNILTALKDRLIYLDGGMGTLLQQAGLASGEYPERWNLTHPDVIQRLHRAYFDVGCNVVYANTFGANRLKFSAAELDDIIRSAFENARAAQRESTGTQQTWVALDIGPSGKLLKPFGDFDFEDAVSMFAETVRLGVKYGADLIVIETMNDCYETKAALLAAKENSTLPVFVSNAYGADGKLMTGASASAMVAMLEAMHADAIGVNCSLGPQALAPVVEQYLDLSSLPVFVKPNAGLPQLQNGSTVYDVDAASFADTLATFVSRGVRMVGGCCGTTPAYLAETVARTKDLSPLALTEKNLSMVSSYTHAVTFGKSTVLVGERINPTGRKALRQALANGDLNPLLATGLHQQECGAQILDVNVGSPEIDETIVLQAAVCELQAVCDLPLQLDTTNIPAMERALRRYNGKAMINSVNGTAKSMAAVFPLVKKYGGMVVALTLDEDGIAQSCEQSVRIAQKILDTAASYGIAKKDLIFDPLVMAISASKRPASVTLDACRQIREVLGCHVILGVSNISFGLPSRDAINSTFFVLAMQSGLSAAILNPDSREMMQTYFAYRALNGDDTQCADFIRFAQSHEALAQAAAPSAATLQDAIIKGLKRVSAELTDALLAAKAPMDILQDEIIPALNQVGDGFEKKNIFLPQLLVSAEAAECAFARIRLAMGKQSVQTGETCSVALSTVQGDIHDIGKNIVRLLLESYGFDVLDLGRDVSPQTIAQAVCDRHLPLVGLSALMTTSIPAMEVTIALLRKTAPWCKIAVGGAVLTQACADAIGADFYAHDAMQTVRFAQRIAAEANA